MKWIPYDGQKLKDETPYLFCYVDTTGAVKYDVGRCRSGKPFVVGNYFVFDIATKIMAYSEIQPYQWHK